MPLKLQDIIDVDQFQTLQDRLNEIYSFPSAIIDLEGNILTATAWQEVCVDFHRKHPECERECIKSDQYILSHLHEANPAVSYRCPHGLIDNATPIIIDGVHYGNFFTGQFFLEPPDMDFFRGMARKYGFNEAVYLDAVRKVPVWSKKQLDSYLFFIKGLIEVITGVGLKNLREIESKKKMQENEERYRQLFDASPDGILLIDSNGCIARANHAQSRMYGFDSPQEMIGLPVSHLVAPSSRDRANEIIRQRLSGIDIPTVEYELLRKDGTTFHGEVTASILRSTDDTLSGYICVTRDMTVRKRYEIQLMDLSQRLQLATSSAHLGIWDWDVRVNNVIWDDRMFELYGIDPEISTAGLLDAWKSAVHPDDREAASAASRAALESGRELDTAFRIRQPDGTVKYIKANALVVRGMDGTPERMIGINVDITEMKSAEEKKNKLESQLLQAQKMESIGRLAGGVAHDFNNMLTVILGYVHIALMELDAASPLHPLFEEIRKAAERSADLTKQLLAFGRKQIIAPRVLDLNETVSSMIKMLQRLIGEDICLNWRPADTLWQVNLDPSQIDQILANLCINARDAITDVGKITIKTEDCTIDEEQGSHYAGMIPGEYVRLIVSDDGCGMDKSISDQIFEPFFTTKGLGKGTGLGLATVYGIVKQNDGFINVYSEPGLGTTFTIYLPRYTGTMGQIRTTTSAAEPAQRGLENILIVEDDPAILKIAALILTKQGYTVLTADSPNEAIRVAGEHGDELHLLITDVVMPEMNGRDLALKLQSHHPRLKCLYMSGYTADVIAPRGVLDTGCILSRNRSR